MRGNFCVYWRQRHLLSARTIPVYAMTQRATNSINTARNVWNRRTNQSKILFYYSTMGVKKKTYEEVRAQHNYLNQSRRRRRSYKRKVASIAVVPILSQFQVFLDVVPFPVYIEKLPSIKKINIIKLRNTCIGTSRTWGGRNSFQKSPQRRSHKPTFRYC